MNEELERLREIAKESGDKISESATFFGLCSEHYQKDPICLIQLSLAILMDKPIFLAIQKGVKISKNLARILEGYEFYEADNLESFEQASKQLMEKIKKRL